jgi:hypothetical protein
MVMVIDASKLRVIDSAKEFYNGLKKVITLVSEDYESRSAPSIPERIRRKTIYQRFIDRGNNVAPHSVTAPQLLRFK